MLKNGVRVIEKKGLCYIAETENRAKRLKPWLGDAVACPGCIELGLEAVDAQGLRTWGK